MYQIIDPTSFDEQSVSTGVITLVSMEFADVGIDMVAGSHHQWRAQEGGQIAVSPN